MKGIVFTEFLDTVDEKFGEAVTDEIVARCPLASGGAYTSVGTYPAGELTQLVTALSEQTNLSAETLQHVYAHRLFGRFHALYPVLFEGCGCPLDFLESVETVIHREVLKIYPDAELPSLETRHRGADTLTLRYRSARRMEVFCRGLIEGCLMDFGATADIDMAPGEDSDGVYHDFTVTLHR